MYRLSVSAGTVLQNMPFEQRVREIAQAGFLVDFWGSEESAIDRIAADPNIEVNAIPGCQWAGVWYIPTASSCSWMGLSGASTSPGG